MVAVLRNECVKECEQSCNPGGYGHDTLVRDSLKFEGLYETQRSCRLHGALLQVRN